MTPNTERFLSNLLMDDGNGKGFQEIPSVKYKQSTRLAFSSQLPVAPN